MIQLRILGPPALETSPGGEPSELAGQPKRLALLAYLAIAGGRHLVSRDQVLGVFWPELPEERARHALSQALHVLRRALGEGADAIVAQGERLGVDSRMLWCDVAAFEHAIRQGDRTRALELYRGPLLDGVFIDAAAEFEQWLEQRRTALREAASGAAARLAEDAVRAGDPRAISIARRAAELAPYDSTATERLVELLDAEGNPGAALAAFESFSRRLYDDCALHPSAALVSRVDGIRRRSPAPASAAASGSPVPVPEVETPVPTRRRARALLSMAAAFTLVMLAGGILWFSGGNRPLLHARAAEAGALARVAVLPFGDSLGRTVVELLSSRLDGAGAIHVLPADSARLGATSTISGSLTEAGDRIHLRATWVRTLDGAVIADATVEGEQRGMFGLLDSLAVKLLAGSAPQPRGDLERIAALTSPSLGPLKSYLKGERAFQEGRFTEATREFELAAQDSGFALAQYRLGVAALWGEDYPLAAADAGGRALRHSGGLPQHAQRLFQGFDRWRHGDHDMALSAYLSIVATDRDNLEAWFQLGETLFHYNPVRGRAVADSRDAFEQTVRLDPDHWGALWHLALLDALQGHTAELDRRIAHLLHLGPRTDYWLELATLRACAHRDAAELSSLSDSLRVVGEGRFLDLAWRCGVFGRDLEGTERMIRLLLERKQVRFGLIHARQLLGSLAMARGRRVAGARQVDSLEQLTPIMALENRTTYALLPLAGRPREELDRLAQVWRTLPDRPRPEQVASRSFYLARLEATLGHADVARALAGQLDRVSDAPEERGMAHALAQEVRALVSGLGSADALRAFESDSAKIWFGILVSSELASQPSARFERAEALERLGRLQEALRWYASLDELSLTDLAYSAPAHFRRAGILERLGDRSGAAAEYSRFIDLWKDADPELQPSVAEAREKLTRLSAHR